MPGHQQQRGLFAVGQASADQALGAGQRQVPLAQVLAQGAAVVVGQQRRVAGAVAMTDQADRLVVELAQGLQLDHRRHLGDAQVLSFFTTGEAVTTLEQHCLDAMPLG
ncbi:hypothetical protein D3C81_1357890 [compost metagenome]